MWVATNFQYAWLFLLVIAPLSMLAIALGTRLNATAAYVLTGVIAIYGLFGVGYLDFFLSQSGQPILNFLYVISPHYHLADLTNRLVFKLGALDGASFMKSTVYLAGVGMLLVGLACSLYREKK